MLERQLKQFKSTSPLPEPHSLTSPIQTELSTHQPQLSTEKVMLFPCSPIFHPVDTLFPLTMETSQPPNASLKSTWVNFQPLVTFPYLPHPKVCSNVVTRSETDNRQIVLPAIFMSSHYQRSFKTNQNVEWKTTGRKIFAFTTMRPSMNNWGTKWMRFAEWYGTQGFRGFCQLPAVWWCTERRIRCRRGSFLHCSSHRCSTGSSSSSLDHHSSRQWLDSCLPISID